MTAWRHKVCRGSGRPFTRDLHQVRRCAVCDRIVTGTRHTGLMPTHTTNRADLQRPSTAGARADATGTP
ncbi:MAG: hypothetical protein LAO77_23100 [Acidobacteriia bacterium]|nr:hypothetical protein [Terriglobia bacterium]